MAVLTRRQLEGIAAYRYKPGGYTWLDVHVMGPFVWTPLSERVPLSIAPNAITLAGLLLVLFATAALLAVSPDLRAVDAPWVYALNAAAIVAYQTLDAIDGKQARRTGSSSPLGQLFDHGCDALSMGMLVLGVAIAAGMSHGSAFVAVFHLVALPFYTGHLEEYHTGTLRTGNSWVGVTEGQLICAAMHALTAVCGPNVWASAIPLPGGLLAQTLTLRDAILAFVVISNAALILGNLWAVCTAGGSLPAEERGFKSLGFKHAVFHMLPYAAFAFFHAIWQSGPSNIADLCPRTFVALICIVYAYLATQLLVAHMAKSPLSLGLDMLLPFSAAVLHARFSLLPQIPEHAVCIALLSYAAVLYLHYVHGAIDEISSRLRIFCFSLAKRAP